MKKVEWQDEYGELVPVCPYCNEWAYDKERCVFCGKPYEYWEPEDLPKPTVVEHEGFKIVQVPSNHIQIYDAKDGRLVYHASCTKKLTEDELREHADFLKKIRKGGAEKCVSCGETIPEGRQVCPGCEGGGRDGKIKP